jgi:hypothetical protein
MTTQAQITVGIVVERRKAASPWIDFTWQAVTVPLRPTDSDPPYRVVAATVDPAEGEAFTEAGNDLIEAVPMPSLIREAVTAFVAQNPAQDHFFKRKRDRANPEALARRVPGREGDGR